MKPGIALILAASMTAATVAYAAEPQEERQTTMKQIGGAMGSLAKMAKGEAEYDAAAARQAFTTISESAEKFGQQFPEGSETGFDTEAHPDIWTNRDDFDARVAKLKADAAAAADSVGDDASDLGAKLGMVGQNCGSCHETYRLKNS